VYGKNELQEVCIVIFYTITHGTQNKRATQPTANNQDCKDCHLNSDNNNNKIEFSLNGSLESAIVEDEEVSIADLQHELMHWHYWLGHISFAKLKRLAMEKEIPYDLQKV
jgi:hypothetical protein